MTEYDPKKGDRIEAVKMPKGKQTIPAGTKGTVTDLYPGQHGLIWITTDEEVKTKIGKGKAFWVCAEEIKKI